MSKPERVGPIAGLLALALLVLNLVATRESPTPDTPTGKMVAELLDHRNAYVASAALIFAQAILLLVFVVAIAALCFSGPARLRTSWRGSRSCPQRRGGGRCTTGSPPCSTLVAPFHCACARVRARIKSGGRLTPGNKAPCFDIRRRGWVVSGRAIR